MAARMYIRGHEIYFDHMTDEWLYSDDEAPVWIERPCKKCGHMPLPTGEDYCLGHIEGVTAACCGHGRDEDAYIQLADGRRFVLDRRIKDDK